MTFSPCIQEFPATRLRRLRRTRGLRALIQENRIGVNDLIQPIFVSEQPGRRAIASMPGMYRTGMGHLAGEAARLYRLGLPAVALFPVIPRSLKSASAREAWNAGGLVPHAVQEIKNRVPGLLVITDVALDPYTSHGHDGLLDRHGHVNNDRTVAALVRQALCHARAGADIISPSDMMDGRIGAVRQALEKEQFINTVILSYAAKYASSLYGPFRDAIGSAAQFGRSSKAEYQVAPPNGDEALRECRLDIAEGADILMVKPALAYLDIVHRVKKEFGMPVFAYMVSGEYSMIHAAAERGWLDERRVTMELLTACRRAGADAVLTYHAERVATWLQDAG